MQLTDEDTKASLKYKILIHDSLTSGDQHGISHFKSEVGPADSKDHPTTPLCTKQLPKTFISNEIPNNSKKKNLAELNKHAAHIVPPNNNHGKHQCFVCLYNTSDKMVLVQHLQEHFGKKHTCPVCARSFSSRQCLRVHINGSADIKSYQCAKCNQSFLSNATLWAHKKEKHSGIIPTKCTNCDFSSVDQRRLKRHMLTHVEERHHKCPQCNYAANSISYLKAHIKRHKAERRYECAVCHSKYTEAYLLKRHLKTHLGYTAIGVGASKTS